MTEHVVRVGIIGAGNVGGALVRLLSDESRSSAMLDAARSRLQVVGVAVKDEKKKRPDIPASLLTTDAQALAAREDVDVLVELIGGVSDARTYIETALRRGASVVTANKALMAEAGTELIELAFANNADLYYEAAVGGGVPILRSLRTSLAAERISRVMGIVNGTTNFILSKMTSDGTDYAAALEEAQALGYAESDPTADVEGYDAAAKVAILSFLSFGTVLDGAIIEREGISTVRAVDVAFAKRSGYVIKLLGIAERVGDHAISRRVQPTLVPDEHPLASVHGAYNAVFVEGVTTGPLMWLGLGAGGEPTAAAVLGDIVAVARNRVSGRHDTPFSVDRTLQSFPPGELQSAFYLSIDVLDKPGVLASVASVFGDHDVSILSMDQSGFGDEARLTFFTHRAFASDVSATLKDLEHLDAVDAIGSCLCVIDGGTA